MANKYSNVADGLLRFDDGLSWYETTRLPCAVVGCAKVALTQLHNGRRVAPVCDGHASLLSGLNESHRWHAVKTVDHD